MKTNLSRSLLFILDALLARRDGRNVFFLFTVAVAVAAALNLTTAQAGIDGPGESCIGFDTELLSLDLSGGPYPIPLASDPGNALGDSIDGYGFVNCTVTITLSSQRATPSKQRLVSISLPNML